MLVYIFQVAIIFSVLYVLYQLVLSRLTFHALNRGVLVSILLVSIFIPLLTSLLPPIIHPIEEIPQFIEQITIATTNTIAAPVHQSASELSFDYSILLKSIYFLGVGTFLFRFFLSLYKVLQLKKQAIAIHQNGHILYETSITDVFSYFHWIFIPKGMVYDPLIITHEKAHGHLRHTIDLLLIELYITFFWWNPLVYYFKKTLRSIHEYQADQQVLKENIKTSDYLQLIVNSLEIKKPHQLYSYFNTPILKKRIHMITTRTSHYRYKFTYVLLLPICALFLIAFTKPITESNVVQHVIKIIEPIQNIPSFDFPVKGSSTEQITAFFDVAIKDPMTKKSKTHKGIDIRASIGTPVIATADGTVFLSKEVGAWGNLIKIKHENGYETWYAHLNNFNTNYGKSVKKGDVIGYVGMTGNSSGPHLHYELRQYKKNLNPLDFLDK